MLLVRYVYGQAYKQIGEALFYENKFKVRTTASGEKYRHSKLTTVHRTLPFGAILEAENLINNNKVTVRVKDWSPFVKGRIIDLSKNTAEKLNFINDGIANVKIFSVGNSNESKKTVSALGHPEIIDDKTTKTFYSLLAKKQNISEYRILIGSYIEMINLVQLVADLQKAYNDRIFIEASVIQGIKQNKIIVETFKTKQTAS